MLKRRPHHLMTRTLGVLGVLLSLMYCTAQPAVAPQCVYVSTAGGIAADHRGARSNAFSLTPTLGFTAMNGSSILVGGSLTTFASNAWSVGGMGALTQRERFGRSPFFFTLDAATSATRLA